MNNPIGQPKHTLDTPCLVIDKTALEYNLKTMQQFATQHGKNIRPHTKTHKCSKLCQLQIEQGSVGISAAKVAEAEILVHNNIPGILITSPIYHSKA